MNSKEYKKFINELYGSGSIDDIQKAILLWGAERNLIDFNLDNELAMLNEELDEYLEADFDDNNYLKLDALCDIYVVYTQTEVKAMFNDLDKELNNQALKHFKLVYKLIPNTITAMGYDFNKCMEEVLKEISSRRQDPKQQEDWEKHGVPKGAKWQKDREQCSETLYKADFSNCLLKDK